MTVESSYVLASWGFYMCCALWLVRKSRALHQPIRASMLFSFFQPIRDKCKTNRVAWFCFWFIDVCYWLNVVTLFVIKTFLSAWKSGLKKSITALLTKAQSRTQSQWSPQSSVVISRLDSGGMEFLQKRVVTIIQVSTPEQTIFKCQFRVGLYTKLLDFTPITWHGQVLWFLARIRFLFT